MTLNSARSWQTSLNSAEDNPSTYAANLKQDARTHLSTYNQTKPSKQCPVQLCYTCRRMKYAEACLATSAAGNRLLTRWQEWCLSLLPQNSAHSVSDILCMFEFQMTDLLGVKLSHTKALCRTAAGLPIRVSKCMRNYDPVTGRNVASTEVPNRKLVLPHSLSPSVSNPPDARSTTLRTVALPCRKVGQRRIGRLKRSGHKTSNRTNKDKNVSADSCRNSCCCCCCCCFNSSSLSPPFDLDPFVDGFCLSSFYSSSVCVNCASGAAGTHDNHGCAPAPEQTMKLHNDNCTPMHASCLGLLEHVEELPSPKLKPATDSRSLVSTGTMTIRRSSSKRHMHRNLQRHHTNRLLPSIVFKHRANLLGGRATHRHLQNARFGSKIKEESSKQTIFFNTRNAEGKEKREEGREDFKVEGSRNHAKSNRVYSNKRSPKEATSMTSRKCSMRGRNAVLRFKVYKTR